MIVKPTSFDVAERAGVSQPTVSRALRNRGGVDPETRRRVLAAAEALGYRPDRRAIGLRSGSTGRLAVVILGTAGNRNAEANPFHMTLLAEMAAAAAQRGFEILVSFQYGAGTFDADYRRNGVADAIIVIGSSKNAAGWRFFGEAHRRGEHIVCWGSPTDALPTVRSDNRAGAARAVEYLVRDGRRRIAFLGPGWRRQRAYRDRRAGYAAVVRGQGLDVLEAPACGTIIREEQGACSTAMLLETHADVDAIFAASDYLAIGAMRAVQQTWREVPRDVAIVGFDGTGSGTYTSPALTTVQQDGRLAASRLVDVAIATIAGHPIDLEPVPTRLLLRESTGSCRDCS